MKHCRSMTIKKRDLVALIVAGQCGVLSPYRYANHFSDSVPKHLIPSKIEHAAFVANSIGDYKSKDAKSFASKLFQLILVERRVLSAHLFYTPDYKYWHIFFFDNRDRSGFKNHWEHGAHIHYVCDLWTNLTVKMVWQKILSGKITLSNKLHIKYARD